MAAPTNVSEPYVGPPLTGLRCIRVLEIYHPTDANGGSGPIQAGLAVEDLDKKPSFDALSYVWGEKSRPPKTVAIGDFSLAITDNCHTAILALRRKLKTFKIWIDVVCINQSDKE